MVTAYCRSLTSLLPELEAYRIETTLISALELHCGNQDSINRLLILGKWQIFVNDEAMSVLQFSRGSYKK